MRISHRSRLSCRLLWRHRDRRPLSRSSLVCRRIYLYRLNQCGGIAKAMAPPTLPAALPAPPPRVLTNETVSPPPTPHTPPRTIIAAIITTTNGEHSTHVHLPPTESTAED